jgi:glyoxylase-like metal-dependent hydrolase (beta-lactamase superfamily II)
MKVGDIEIVPVIDGAILSALPSSKPLPDAGSVQWQEQHGMVRSDGLVESTLGAFLVLAQDRVALVDAGAGQDFPGGYTPPVVDLESPDDPIAAPMRAGGLPDEHLQRLAADLGRTRVTQGRLPESLDLLGVRAEDITDVILTHLHFDHIGWASAQGLAFFPNATIRCASADLDHFLPGTMEESFLRLVYGAMTVGERLGPVLDRIETWESDCTVLPGVDVRLAPGHTPGSSVVVVSDGPARALLLGDVIHCPLELTEDDFNFLVDHDQDMANAVRAAYAQELEATGIPAAASHFPGLRFGRLLPGEGVRRWTFGD